MKVTGDRETQMGDGNYIEKVGGDSVNDKVTLNAGTNINVIAGKVIFGENPETNNTKKSESALDKEQNPETQHEMTFVFTGTLTADSEVEFNGKKVKIKALIQHLEKFCDGELTILDTSEGSVRLRLGGSPEDLERLQELFESGELNEVLGIPVQDVQLINAEAKDDEAKIEIDEKSRLIEEIRTKYVYHRNLSDADLSDADLSGANLKGADLRNADLSGANLKGADLSDAMLVQSNLSFSHLNGANLNKANLIGANLSHAFLLKADLTYAALSKANVENARFGYNSSISDSLKRDLIARGAIFEDSPPGDRSRALTPV